MQLDCNRSEYSGQNNVATRLCVGLQEVKSAPKERGDWEWKEAGATVGDSSRR